MTLLKRKKRKSKTGKAMNFQKKKKQERIDLGKRKY